MRLSSIILSAIEILSLYSKKPQDISNIIRFWSKNNRSAGSKDRHLISNIIYNIFRQYPTLVAVSRSEEWEKLVLFSLLLSKDAFTVEDLYTELEKSKYSRHLLSFLPSADYLQHIVLEHDIDDTILANIPSWLKPYFQLSFGSNWVIDASALSHRAPIDIRVNLLKASVVDVKQSLLAAGYELHNTIMIHSIPEALRLPAEGRLAKKQNLTNTEDFLVGNFEIQDLGSQLISKMVDVKPNMNILDYCAGAGGKSLSLAAEMNNQGNIYAYDKYIKRLYPIYERSARASASIIKPIENISKLDLLKDSFDKVIVDAPCSGSGTWRRFPDRKYLLTEVELKHTISQQQKILQLASQYVRVGGELCYMTCSLFICENDDQIEEFCKKNLNFKVMDAKSGFIDKFGEDAKKYIYFN